MKAKSVSEILFYHLTETRLEQVLPALVERSLGRGWNVAVQCPDEAQAKRLDAFLWEFSDASFLPHGIDTEAHSHEQPVLLSCGGENQNEAYVCFCLAGAALALPQNFSRLCLIFDGHDAAQVEAARAAWRKWQAEEGAAGKLYQLTYWQQTPQRKWVKQG